MKNLLSRFLPIFSALLILSSCSGISPDNDSPYIPEQPESDSAEGSWEEVLQSDPAYPDNVYLTELVEFYPGKVGSARRGDTEHYDGGGYPLENFGALGPPEGSYPSTMSNPDATMTVLGSGGWAVWRFNPDYRIINGEGDDFITFSNHNVFSSDPDNSWNELGRVYISSDLVNWYKNSAISYTTHPDPGAAANGYDWDAVRGLHGNTHSWANFRRETQGEERNTTTGCYTDLIESDGTPIIISRYFKPDAENLGGDSFDLSAFIHCDNGDPWPSDGKMSYIKIVDDPAILDGQDWNPDWMTGVRVMSVMGINIVPAEGSP